MYTTYIYILVLLLSLASSLKEILLGARRSPSLLTTAGHSHETSAPWEKWIGLFKPLGLWKRTLKGNLVLFHPNELRGIEYNHRGAFNLSLERPGTILNPF